MSIESDFRQSVETFLADFDILPTEFGVRAVNNPSFVSRLRGGMSPRVATVDQVAAFMREYREQHQQAQGVE